MTFDVMIGNPPYNKGLDINFMSLAVNMNTRIISFILTAKWLLAEQNRTINSINCGELRDAYIKHVSKITYFPCSKDVFDIMQSEGVVSFIYNKDNSCKECEITNICNENTYYNSVVKRSINNKEPLLNVVYSVIKDMNIHYSFRFNSVLNKRYQVWINGKTPGGGFYSLNESRGKMIVLGKARIIDTYNNESSVADSKLEFSSDSIDECKSFISFLDTKLVRFLVLGCIGKLSNIMTEDNFRYVPYTDDFSFIYTDEYMYKKYNISAEQIEIIDNTIKDRSQLNEV